MNVNFVDIQKMSKEKWKSIIKQTIKEYTFRKLIERKETHSKVKDLVYSKFEIQDYLKPCSQIITRKEIELIFKLRSKMVNIKANYKGSQKTIECSSCNNGEETQEHIYNSCEVLNNEDNEKVYEKPDYKSINTGNIEEKLKIAQIFMQRMKIHEKYSKEGKS